MLKTPIPYMDDAVEHYLQNGISPGGFLLALFSNDLKETFKRADFVNITLIKEWVGFMVNEMPWIAQGSPEVVAAWIASGGLKGKKDA